MTYGEERVNTFVNGAVTSMCTAGVGALLAAAVPSLGSSAVIAAMVAGGCYFGANELRAHIRDTFFEWPEFLIGTTRAEFISEVYAAQYGRTPDLATLDAIVAETNRFISVNTVSRRTLDPKYSPEAIAKAVAEVARKAQEAAAAIAREERAVQERQRALLEAAQKAALAAPGQRAELLAKAALAQQQAGQQQAGQRQIGVATQQQVVAQSNTGLLVFGGLTVLAAGIIFARGAARGGR